MALHCPGKGEFKVCGSAELQQKRNKTPKDSRTTFCIFFFFLKDIYSSLMVCQVEVKFWEGLKLFIDQKVVIELKPIFKA